LANGTSVSLTGKLAGRSQASSEKAALPAKAKLLPKLAMDPVACEKLAAVSPCRAFVSATPATAANAPREPPAPTGARSTPLNEPLPPTPPTT